MKFSRLFIGVLILILSMSILVMAEDVTDASDIGIIGGADGPTAVIVADSNGNSESFIIENENSDGTDITVHTFKESDLEAAKEAESDEINLNFEPSNFIRNLPIMGKGMLGIFIVIGIIIAAVYVLGAFGKKKD